MSLASDDPTLAAGTAPAGAAAAPRPCLAGRYRLGRQIGSGGMGRVYEAFDEQLERAVAVKLMALSDLGDRERRELFLRESRLLAQLSHPSIVAVHEAGEDQGTLYLVMGLIDGVSLSELLRRVREDHAEGSGSGKVVPRRAEPLAAAIGKPVPQGRHDLLGGQSWYRAVARIAAELAGVLEAAHGAGVIHRDLKPGNVMLLGGGTPVVLDFGLAGRLGGIGEGELTSSLTGTIAYFAPEQVRSLRIGSDVRTDVYQLGLILYELLTLRRAFPGTTFMEVQERIKSGIFPRPRRVNPAVPRDLEAICLKALETAPANRYATARALRIDLERYLDGTDVPVAVGSTLFRRLSRSVAYGARRHPALGAVALVLFAVPAALWWSQWRSLPTYPDITRAARRPAHGAAVLALTEQGEVRPGDELCLELASAGPTFLYGLSVFEEPGWDQPLVRAIEVMKLAGSDGKVEKLNTWDNIVPPGRHEVVVCAISQDTLATREGLLVFASSVQEPWLEAGLQRICDAAAGELELPVPYDEAMRHLSSALLDPSKGIAPTAEAVRRLERLRLLLRPEHLRGQQAWPAELADLKRFEHLARVAP